MIEVYVMVVCDAEHCGEESGPSHTRREARQWARREGWATLVRQPDGRMLDLCQRHRSEPEGEKHG